MKDTMLHECFVAADKELAPLNTCIDWALSIDTRRGTTVERLTIRTKKLNPKVRAGPSVLVVTYCPFCGVKL